MSFGSNPFLKPVVPKEHDYVIEDGVCYNVQLYSRVENSQDLGKSKGMPKM